MSVFTRSGENKPLPPATAAYWALTLLWFAAAVVPLLLIPLSGDETYYFYFSQLLKHGGRLFDQYCLEDKPGGMQLIYFLFTPFQDGLWNFYTVRALTIVYQLATSLMFYVLCKRYFYRDGRIAKALLLIFILVYANPMVEGQFSNADNFTVLWIILAAYFFLIRRHLFSALAIGICFCLKQNTALEILPSSTALIAQELLRSRDAFGRRLLRASQMVSKQFLVFLVPIGMIWLCTVHLGTSDNFLASAFIRRIHSHLLHKNYAFAARYGIPIFRQSAILWMGLFGFMLDWPRRRWADAGTRVDAGGVPQDFDLYLLIWAACALMSVWIGGYFYPHYFIELVPVLVIGATVFLMRINREVFYVLIAAAIVLSQRLSATGNIVAALVCCALAVADRRLQADRNIWRLPVVLSCLVLTLNQNPISSMLAITKIVNPLMYYAQNDRDVLAAARYLKINGLREVFVYDYTAQIYCLSGIIPRFRYGLKCQYINCSILIKDDLNNPDDARLLGARREDLAARIKGGDFQYVVINYNTVRVSEGPQMRPMIDALGRFRVHKIFGNVWIYKINHERTAVGRRYRVARAFIDDKAESIKIGIERSGLVPESAIDLTCGGLEWHYPENGIIYPMKAVQDEKYIEITANRRGFTGGDCTLLFSSILETRIFSPVKVSGIPKKIG